MITKEEVGILKDLLINKSLEDTFKLIGFEYKEDSNKSSKLNEEIWKDIKDDVLKVYKINIQKTEYNKLRKKIEVKNARLGFVVPQNKLVAKEKVNFGFNKNLKKKISRGQPKIENIRNSKSKKTTTERRKFEKREKSFKRSIFLYFQSISYDKDIHKIYKSNDSFKNIKEYLTKLFKNHDESLSQKIGKSKTFSSLFFSLPKDKDEFKNICKLIEFEKKTNKKRFTSENKSIRTISIPMGGQKR